MRCSICQSQCKNRPATTVATPSHHQSISLQFKILSKFSSQFLITKEFPCNHKFEKHFQRKLSESKPKSIKTFNIDFLDQCDEGKKRLLSLPASRGRITFLLMMVVAKQIIFATSQKNSLLQLFQGKGEQFNFNMIFESL